MKRWQGLSILAMVLFVFGLPTTDAQVSFAPAATHAVGQNPGGISIGDVDGDGDNDLAVTNDLLNAVDILLNSGNGIFVAGPRVVVSRQLKEVRLVDLNGDGRLDIATSNGASASASVALNNGQGGFGLATSYATGATSRGLAAADLDRDFDIDLAVANEDGSTVSVLLNNGNGTFAAAINLPVGTEPRDVVAADLDRDGDHDLVAANHRTRTVSVLMNTGRGSFAGAVSYTVGGNVRPEGVTAADVDGDGDIDIVTANGDDNNVSVLLNNGTGLFGGPTFFVTGSDAGDIVAADLDGDGDLDLATADKVGNSLSVLVNNGTGSFAAPLGLSTGTGPEHLDAGDLDGDGDLDLATANKFSNNVSLFQNTTANVTGVASVRLGGDARIGTTVPVLLTSTADAAHLYMCGFSTAPAPGIPVPGNRLIGLAPTPMLFLSVQPNPIFINTRSTLGSTGAAFVRLAIPNLAALRGQSIYSAFIVVNPRDPSGIGTVSPTLKITMQ